MKNKIIGIIAGLVCCAVFAGAIVFMSLSDNSESMHEHAQDEQSSQQASQHEFSHNSDYITSREDIASVTVTSGGKSYTAEVTSNGIPQIIELKGIKQDVRLANALITLCKSIHPYKLVEQDAADLGKYGLDQPEGVGEIVYKDSTKVRVLIGDVSPGDERYVYASVQGSDKVWLVESSVRTYLTGKAEDFVSTVMTPVSEATETLDAKLTVGKKGSADIVVQRNSGRWHMSLPIKAELDMQKASATVNGLYGLNAQYCECIRPDDTKLAEYGLKEPAVTVSFTEGTVDLTLFIGNAVKRDDSSEQEKYYCFVKGSSDTECIYAVARQYLPWVEITAQELISEVMLPNYLVNLRSVEITADGKKAEYVITNEGGDNTKINEDISKMRTVSVKCGEKELEIYKFRQFYELLMKCPTNKIFTEDVKGDAELTVVYNKNDGTADRLELVKTGEGYGARVNAKMSYFVPQSWADAVTADINALADGKTLRTDF